MPNLPHWIWAGSIGVVGTAAILLLARGVLGPAGLRWAAAAAAAAFIAACLKLNLVQRFPPIQREQWLPCVAVLLAVAGIVDAMWKIAPGVRWLFAVLICGGLSVLLFFPFRLTVWAEQGGWLWMGLIAAAMLGSWGSIDELDRRCGTGAAVMAIVGLFAAVVAALSGYLTIGPVAVALASACGAAFLIQLLARPETPESLRGLAIVGAPLLGAILFLTLVTAALTRLNLCLLLSAIFLPHIVTPLARRKPKLTMVLQIAIALIPLAIAAALAKREFDAAMQEMGM